MEPALEIIVFMEGNMKQDSKDNNLSLVLKCVDEFAKLYIDAVLGWAEQNQCSLLDITFSLGAAPYKFPPDMIVKINGHKKIIYDFELPYKRATNYGADGYARVINQFIEESPELLQPVIKKMNGYLLRLKKAEDLNTAKPEQDDAPGGGSGPITLDCSSGIIRLTRQGFFKEMPHGFGSTLSIYSFIQEEKDEDEEKICGYLREGKTLIPGSAEVKDVINSKNGVIGRLNFLTDGTWL